MPIAFDAAASGSTSVSSASLTIAGVVANNPNRYLAVPVSYLNFGVTLNTVTWNGGRLTKQAGFDFAAGAAFVEYWDMINPDAGSFNLVLTFSAATDANAGLISLYNANQSASRFVIATNSGTSTGPTVTVASATDQIVVTSVGWRGGVTNTPDATWTNDWNLSTVDPANGGGHKAGAASITRTDLLSASGVWGAIAASIKSTPSASVFYLKA